MCPIYICATQSKDCQESQNNSNIEIKSESKENQSQIQGINFVLNISRYRKWCISSSAVLACIGIGLEQKKTLPCIHLYPVCTRGSFVILDYPWCSLIFLEINGIHHFLVGFKWNWSNWVYCAQPSPSWLSVQIPSPRSFPIICPKRVLGH